MLSKPANFLNSEALHLLLWLLMTVTDARFHFTSESFGRVKYRLCHRDFAVEGKKSPFCVCVCVCVSDAKQRLSPSMVAEIHVHITLCMRCVCSAAMFATIRERRRELLKDAHTPSAM